MKNPLLVSFSSRGREDYNQKSLRLIDSAKQHWQGDMLFYSPDHYKSNYEGTLIYPGWPKPKQIVSFTHSEMPYQFKIALIQEAIEKGYTRIAWLDSGMIIQKDLSPLFNPQSVYKWMIHKNKGVTVFHNLGHDLYKYISDDAVYKLGITELELQTIPQIWGGALFFDFTKKNARDVFEKIKEFSINGSFKEGGSTRTGFIAHRHDQAVMSVLMHGKCNILPYGKIKCPPHDTTGEYGDDCYLVSK